MFSQCISVTNVNTWSSLWKCYGIVFLVSWMKDIVIKINVGIPIVSVVSFMVWWLIPSRSIYGAEFVKLFFSSTFPYQTHNKPNANKKNPLFSFRLKLINPMTRAKVSNQGGTVNWCISLSDCSCNKRVQSQKVQRQSQARCFFFIFYLVMNIRIISKIFYWNAYLEIRTKRMGT